MGEKTGEGGNKTKKLGAKNSTLELSGNKIALVVK